MTGAVWGVLGIIIGILLEKFGDRFLDKKRLETEYKRELNRKKIEAYQTIISEMVMFQRYCRDIYYKSILNKKVNAMMEGANMPFSAKEDLTNFMFDIHGLDKSDKEEIVFVPLNLLNDMRNRILKLVIFISNHIKQDIEKFFDMTAKFEYLSSNDEKLKSNVDNFEKFVDEFIEKCKKEIHDIKTILK